MSKMIDLALSGVTRITCKHFSHNMDHIELTVNDGVLDPMGVMHSPKNMADVGRDPVPIMVAAHSPDADIWEEYVGPLPTDQAYQDEQARLMSEALNGQ